MSTATVQGVETRTYRVAVAGNPNSGKTTVFNGLTGGKQRIGNWPGVTVEKIEGRVRVEDKLLSVVDLPGIYALSAYSEDERVARDYILSRDADLVVNIVDATNFERNLFLTTQLIEMGVPTLVVLNMMDLAAKRNISINTDLLAKQLDLPVIAISAVYEKDINRLAGTIAEQLERGKVSTSLIEFPNEIEDVITRWRPELGEVADAVGTDERWVAIKLLEKDDWIERKVVDIDPDVLKLVGESIESAEKVLHEPTESILTDYRYGFIHGLSKSVIRRGRSREDLTDKIDKIVMHRVLGIPFFLLAMYLVFWVTINLGGAFIDFFDLFFQTAVEDSLREVLLAVRAPVWIVTIAAAGLGAGIRTVATFIPVIFMMFLMLSLLEDSGYMARAAFIMDGFMRRLGLPGKSFVPLIVGFGCTVPAVLATRTLDNKKDRYLTIFITPLMSCGARLPVYALFATAFFPNAAGNIVFSLYLMGIVLAVVTGLVMKRTVFRGEASHFIMELPPYHAPRLRHIMIHTWIRLKVFILRAGVVIVLAVTLLSFVNSLALDGSFGNENTEKSLLTNVGKVATPVFGPMGIEEDNWPATVALLTGVFAKEAIVGTLNSLYAQIEAAERSAAASSETGPAGAADRYDFWGGIGDAFRSIPEGLAEAVGLGDWYRRWVSGVFRAPGGEEPGAAVGAAGTPETPSAAVPEKVVFSAMRKRFTYGGPQAYAYLLFVLIYFPCIGALSAIIREMGKGFALLNVAYLTVLAWIVATLFFQIAVAHRAVWIAVPLAMLGAIYGVLRIVGWKSGIESPVESE